MKLIFLLFTFLCFQVYAEEFIPENYKKGDKEFKAVFAGSGVSKS